MYYFFARLGRKPWIKFVLPTVSIAASSGYLGTHYVFHSLIRRLYTAQNRDGRKEELTPELKNTIIETYEDIKNDFNKPIVDGIKLYFSSWKPIIKWFPTSSLDPQVFGMVETYSGVLIGLPYYYNYDKVTELPDEAYSFKKMSLFKSSPFKDDKTKQESSEDDEFFNQKNSDSIVVDPLTSIGKAYLDSLILSKNAKKFSIARELCYADSYRVSAQAFVILISTIIPVIISRLAVSKLKLNGYHLSHRLPFYMLAGVAGLGHYYFLSDSIETYYSHKSDSRALATSQYYREGGKEYFEKLLQRNKALRELSKEFKLIYDDKGNLIEGMFRNRYIPLTTRLEEAAKSTTDTQSNH